MSDTSTPKPDGGILSHLWGEAAIAGGEAAAQAIFDILADHLKTTIEESKDRPAVNKARVELAKQELAQAIGDFLKQNSEAWDHVSELCNTIQPGSGE